MVAPVPAWIAPMPVAPTLARAPPTPARIVGAAVPRNWETISNGASARAWKPDLT